MIQLGEKILEIKQESRGSKKSKTEGYQKLEDKITEVSNVRPESGNVTDKRTDFKRRKPIDLPKELIVLTWGKGRRLTEWYEGGEREQKITRYIKSIY